MEEEGQQPKKRADSIFFLVMFLLSCGFALFCLVKGRGQFVRGSRPRLLLESRLDGIAGRPAVVEIWEQSAGANTRTWLVMEGGDSSASAGRQLEIASGARVIEVAGLHLSKDGKWLKITDRGEPVAFYDRSTWRWYGSAEVLKGKELAPKEWTLLVETPRRNSGDAEEKGKPVPGPGKR